MERTTYKVPKFFLDKPQSKKPTAIFMKYSFAPGQRLSYFTGERIDPSKWNSDEQRVKRNVTGGSEINDTLDVLSETAQKTLRDYRLLKKTVTKEILKNKLDNAIHKQATKSGFFEILDHFIDTESKLKSWTKGTHTKLNTIKKQLKDFEASQRKKNRSYRIDFNSINEGFFEELITFWQTECYIPRTKDESKPAQPIGLRNSTIQKNIHILRWFFNWCVDHGYLPEGFKRVKINLKQAKKKVIFVDMSEISKINNFNIPAHKEYLQRTRDIFIFQCFTGLRFSDLRNLKSTGINGDTIYITTIKTGETIEIELNEATRTILNKYKTHREATGQALPVPVNQVYNKFLKELAKLAGLDEKITLVHYQGAERIEKTYAKHQLICSHTARRSFITNGLALGIGSEVIRSWTGHQSDKSFKAYYEIVKERKKTDIAKFTL